MRKWWICLLCLLCLTGAARAERLMYVEAQNADRVHLRAEPSAQSQSLGLYFTGTPVFGAYTENQEWIRVFIGAEEGYMIRDRLSEGSPARPQWRMATVKPTSKTGWVNLRSAPTTEAPVQMKLGDGAQVIVLGETVSRWCYVRAGEQYGYMMSQYLRVSDRVWDSAAAGMRMMPENIPSEWVFSSGVGAWSTFMTILPDGTFWGYYHDADMGDDGPGYPHGTLYECVFTGRFTSPVRVSQWEYQMRTEDLQTFGIQGSQVIRDQTLVVTTSPAGLSEGALMRIFLPGTPKAMLSQESIFDEEYFAGNRYYMFKQNLQEIIWQEAY